MDFLHAFPVAIIDEDFDGKTAAEVLVDDRNGEGVQEIHGG